MRIPKSLPPNTLQLVGLGVTIKWARISESIWKELQGEFIRCSSLNQLLHPTDESLEQGLLVGGIPHACEVQLDGKRLSIPDFNTSSLNESSILKDGHFIANVETLWGCWDTFEINPVSYDISKITTIRNRLSFAGGLTFDAIQMHYESFILSSEKCQSYSAWEISTGTPILIEPDGSYELVNISG